MSVTSGLVDHPCCITSVRLGAASAGTQPLYGFYDNLRSLVNDHAFMLVVASGKELSVYGSKTWK
jgi:hypothetical protein